MLHAFAHAVLFDGGDHRGGLALLRKALSISLVDDGVVVCIFADVDVGGAVGAVQHHDVDNLQGDGGLLAHGANVLALGINDGFLVSPLCATCGTSVNALQDGLALLG